MRDTVFSDILEDIESTKSILTLLSLRDRDVENFVRSVKLAKESNIQFAFAHVLTDNRRFFVEHSPIVLVVLLKMSVGKNIEFLLCEDIEVSKFLRLPLRVYPCKNL